jgi:hypothetical protein
MEASAAVSSGAVSVRQLPKSAGRGRARGPAAEESATTGADHRNICRSRKLGAQMSRLGASGPEFILKTKTLQFVIGVARIHGR